MWPRIKRWLYRGGRPGAVARAINRAFAAFHGAGAGPQSWVTLEVLGRKSGRTTAFPVVVVFRGGERFLVSMLGDDAAWVRNVEAAGGAAMVRHGGAEVVRLEPVPALERAPILKAYLYAAPGARPHVPVAMDAPLAEFAGIAAKFPVYRVASATESQLGAAPRVEAERPSRELRGAPPCVAALALRLRRSRHTSRKSERAIRARASAGGGAMKRALGIATAGFVFFLFACGKDAAPSPSPAPESASAAAAPASNVPPMDATNIVSIASGSPDHTTLVAALKAADYVTSVAGSGPLTVFAPTNAAFDALPPGTLDDLVKPENVDRLRNILKYHVTTSGLTAASLFDGQVLGMANGAKAEVHKDGDAIAINGANVVASIPASNGVVHVIDAVLLPPAK
jgi:uncharacterized surface protein with fasciclin (FAS1) repeats